MTRFRLLLCCALLASVGGRAGSSRPSDAEVNAVVARLGAEAREDRVRAQEELEAWADAYPRFVLVTLARAYRETEDMEVEYRLRHVLKPLAQRYLFHRAPGFLGVNLGREELDDGRIAILLNNVRPGLAADKAGLQAGDLILTLDGKPMEEVGREGGIPGFSRAIAERPPGTRVELGVRRGNEEFTVRAVLVMRPENVGRTPTGPVDREKAFQNWLRGLRPHAVENGIPVGHFPAGE